MRTRVWMMLATAGVLAVVAMATATAASAGFVQRSGGNFTLDGSTYRFVGHNNYRLPSMSGGYVCGGTLSQSQVDSILQDAKDSGAKVIRTWFFQSYYQGQSNHWAAFDRVLNSAAAKGLKVIPVLVNQWEDCEPQADLNGDGHSDPKNHGFYSSAFRSAGFGYPLSFKDYATTVAQHYASNQTIAFWQLVNEAEAPYQWTSNNTNTCGSDAAQQDAARDALRGFADEMTTAIKAVDPNHLVSLGTMGSGQCGTSGSARYSYVHGGSVDMCEYHDYYAGGTSSDDVIRSIPDDGHNRLRQRIDDCNAIGKPLFIGEAGIVADVGDQGESLGPSGQNWITLDTLQRRGGFFDSKMTAAFQNGIDGYVIWDKIPEASNSTYNANSGRFGVGPSSLFNDRTNAVTTAQASNFGFEPGSLRSGFEDGTLGGWEVAWGGGQLTLYNTGFESWGGYRSLQLSLCCGAGWPAARTRTTTGAGPGTTIVFHVYRLGNAPGSVQAKPYVSNNGWSNTFGPDMNLKYGWNELEWTIPAGVSTPLQAIGLQINNGGGYSGNVYLDDARW